jgi:hypothetical protein
VKRSTEARTGRRYQEKDDRARIKEYDDLVITDHHRLLREVPAADLLRRAGPRAQGEPIGNDPT